MHQNVLDLPLERHPAAAIRPESFGALVYHYHNRRLVFLKTVEMVALVNSLSDHPDARTALLDSGVSNERHRDYAVALERLIDSEVVRVRSR